MKISVCIPCYKSAKTLPFVVRDIKKAFKQREGYELQLILVNDGSGDDTFSVIRELCMKDSRITGVDLSRNYGQINAKMVALQYVKGDVVVFMDDDGQHPADGIFKLVDEIVDNNLDVVYAYFPKKKHSAFKRITSNLKNRLSEAMGNKPKNIHVASFSAWSRMIADAVKDNNNPFISVGALLTHLTTKFGNVEIEHKERISGKSGYTLKRLLKLWLNGFISFSMIPLRVVSVMGFFLIGGGAIWGIVMLIISIVKKMVFPGYLTVLVVVLLLCGFLMIFLGIIGEYIGRIYMTIGGMPQYNIRCVVRKKPERILRKRMTADNGTGEK